MFSTFTESKYCLLYLVANIVLYIICLQLCISFIRRFRLRECKNVKLAVVLSSKSWQNATHINANEIA